MVQKVYQGMSWTLGFQFYVATRCKCVAIGIWKSNWFFTRGDEGETLMKSSICNLSWKGIDWLAGNLDTTVFRVMALPVFIFRYLAILVHSPGIYTHGCRGGRGRRGERNETPTKFRGKREKFNWIFISFSSLLAVSRRRRWYQMQIQLPPP